MVIISFSGCIAWRAPKLERPLTRASSIQASFFSGVILATKKKDGFAKEKASDLSEKGPVKPL